MTTLYKHQQDFLSQNPNKSSLVWSCGTGKTRTAIEWGQCTQNSLIICPKALKTNWERECTRYFHHGIPWSVAIISKEEFRRDWQKLPAFESVIIDEVHNGFLTPNFKSQMSKALRGYLKKHNVPRVLLLSATVYTSSPWNIYNLAYYTGHIWNYNDFKYKFFQPAWFGPRQIWQPKKGIEGELAKLTQSIASVVDIHDCLDVPEQLHLDPEYFALTKEQIKAIKDNYDPLPIVRYTAQHEIENGILLGNEFREGQTFESDKNERILELIKENQKIAIVCRYNAQIDALKNLLEKNEMYPLVINGGVENRDFIVEYAENKLKRAVVLIQADCAEGYQLPSFELCIFASMSYSYTKWEQICGRFLRMDKPSRTTFMYLLTEGESIDQAVYNSIKKKESFQIELYNKQ